MVDISRAWYNGSCSMAAKPIMSLELHIYTMIQFLINVIVYIIVVITFPYIFKTCTSYLRVIVNLPGLT